ncbi:methyltransferase domain-containing protein [Thermoactinomyces sp. CICC 24226]|uniref:protein-L-isoaspartate O-methyltransferase family protein n=1 Tax=Thermoactinomyces sp. CICC 24226 TaxID=2767431 RepID=UPI0018DE4D7B|nr:methyltransferase domain-containing protein [Thermoactinomyces sp. CICC 24226]MBI0390779.1 methyltransferase domain-containing protein [Thermoactinomyces sp. CICC 24226]
MPTIPEVFQRVNREKFIRKEDGSLIPQISSDGAIRGSLELLDVQKGQRVLEIGTGSAYSTALIALLSGPDGKVVSLDIEPKLTRRACRMFEDQNLHQVQFETRDGRNGWAAGSPYDRIVAWTTPDLLPEAWKHQLKEGGWVVTPFKALPIADTNVVVRLIKRNGKLKGENVIPGSYIAMTERTPEEFFGPWIHAHWSGEGENPWWVSSSWMERPVDSDWVCQFLYLNPTTPPFPEVGDELRAFLLAVNPDGLTTAERSDGSYIGYSSPEGFALLSLRDSQWITTDERHAHVLIRWRESWNRQKRPSYSRIKAWVVGKRVRVELKKEPEPKEI